MTEILTRQKCYACHDGINPPGTANEGCQCSTCEGTGYLQSWNDIDTFLEELRNHAFLKGVSSI